MNIPFVDLNAQYRAHRREFDDAVASVISNSAFIGGTPVQEFERLFAERLGVQHCISCANGTDAIYIALRMMGVGPGDEVITTATSWISTSETISQAGATPVFVDVDRYYTIDTDRLEDAITDRTRAVIPVHLYGQPAQMTRMMDICSTRGLFVIEDCAQAHFAQWQGRRVGTFGHAGTFSFYPGKNLGAWGDAGAIVTNDDQLALKCRMYANHGALVKHEHQMEGINSRMDGLQAALLTTKLRFIGDWTARRREIAWMYDRLLDGVGDLALPLTRHGADHVYHLYVVRTQHRDRLRTHLEGLGVATGIHYPTPLPLLPAYRHLGLHASSFPNADSNQQQILSLPIFPEMTQSMVEYVVRAIVSFFEKGEATD